MSDAARLLDDRMPVDKGGRMTRLHDELVLRARAAQDAVFADASVDRRVVLDSLKALGDRLIAQLEAMATVGRG